MKIKLLLFLFSFSCLFLAAQQPTFKAQSDALKIVEDSYVDVKFILSNSEGSGFKPPSFKNFEVVGGPNRSNSMTIVNGVVKQTQSFGYALRPKTKGKLTIGSASIRTKSGFLKTKPFVIEVVKGNPSKNKTVNTFFIETNLSDSIAYVGQQLILEYKLYTTEEVRSINFMNESDYDGFFKQGINSNRESVKREIINGVEYATKIVKRIALYPQQTGTYELEPVTIRLGIADKNNRSRGFFFSNQLKEKRVQAEGKTIIVANNPPTNGNSFSGAIGKYTMNAQASKRSLTTDDAIVVNMSIQGNGDSKTVSAPIWQTSDSLEIYDPNIIEDETFQNGSRYIHKKTFEYLIVPKFPGVYKITPEFTYLDTDKDQYVTLKKMLPPFNVLKGSQSTTVIDDDKSLDIRPISKNIYLSKQSNKIHGTPLYWSFLTLLLASIGGIFYYNNHLTKSGQKDPDLIRKNRALALAQQRLESSKALMSSNNTSQFYEELSVAVKKFISDKYGIPALHINKSEILNQLEVQNLTGSNHESFAFILGESEKALYAPSLATNMDEIYSQTVELFTNLEG